MNTFWRDAIERGDLAEASALLGRGADVDALDRYGQTGLMLAARAGDLALVEVLVRHGASLNVTAKVGLSALMLAVVGRHAEVARLLARAGCDLAVRGSGAPGFAGKTASDLALASDLPELAAELSVERF